MDVETEGGNTEQWYLLSYSQKKKNGKKKISIINKRRKGKEKASSIIRHGNQDVWKDCGSVSNFTILNLPQNVKKEIMGRVHGMCV